MTRKIKAADKARQQAQAHRGFDERLQALVLFLRLRLRAADSGRDAGQNLERIGRAAVRRQAALEVAVKARASSTDWCAVNTSSAVAAASSCPSSDEPACTITG